VNIVKVEVPCVVEDNVTLDVLSVAPGPPKKLRLRVTVPLKPLRLARAIVEDPEKPAGNVKDAGLDEMVKSGGAPTVTVMLAEWVSEPLVPIRLTE
jgi:hypothetical protein